MTIFAKLASIAQSGASGHGKHGPTPAQAEAGNYKKARFRLHGFDIVIESPRGALRHWKAADGTQGSNLMKFDYGYIAGTKGADGDELDCFIGPWPEKDRVYVINQFINGQFDEHKLMFGFPDQRTAEGSYLSNYTPGWKGIGSCIVCSTHQLAWWVKNGDMSAPITDKSLPYEEVQDMHDANFQKTFWDGAKPRQKSVADVLYELHGYDAHDGLLLDAVLMPDILGDADSVSVLDALIIPQFELQRRMAVFQKAMNRAASGDINVLAMQISDPFKQRSTTNIAVIFELSDGQTITTLFHNSDTTPNKIEPDALVTSWKWMLNKMDVTLVAAPERGHDLNPVTVATRLVALALANSARFAKANANRAARMEKIDEMKGQVMAKEDILSGLLSEIEVKQGEIAAATKAKEAALDKAAQEVNVKQDEYIGAQENGGTNSKTGQTKGELSRELDAQAETIRQMKGEFEGEVVEVQPNPESDLVNSNDNQNVVIAPAPINSAEDFHAALKNALGQGQDVPAPVPTPAEPSPPESQSVPAEELPPIVPAAVSAAQPLLDQPLATSEDAASKTKEYLKAYSAATEKINGLIDAVDQGALTTPELIVSRKKELDAAISVACEGLSGGIDEIAAFGADYDAVVSSPEYGARGAAVQHYKNMSTIFGELAKELLSDEGARSVDGLTQSSDFSAVAEAFYKRAGLANWRDATDKMNAAVQSKDLQTLLDLIGNKDNRASRQIFEFVSGAQLGGDSLGNKQKITAWIESRDLPAPPLGTGVGDPKAENPERTSDMALLQSVISGECDMWVDGLGERIEGIAKKYEDDGDIIELWAKAVRAYTLYMRDQMKAA